MSFSSVTFRLARDLGFGCGGTCAGRRRAGLRAVPAAPDQAVYRDEPGDVAQSGDERYEEQCQGADAGRGDGPHVDDGRPPGAAGRDVVPELVEPEPGLAWVVAGLVHHAPLIALQVLGGGQVPEVRAVLEEEQRLGEVGAVELPLREQVGVERAA